MTNPQFSYAETTQQSINHTFCRITITCMFCESAPVFILQYEQTQRHKHESLAGQYVLISYRIKQIQSPRMFETSDARAYYANSKKHFHINPLHILFRLVAHSWEASAVARAHTKSVNYSNPRIPHFVHSAQNHIMYPSYFGSATSIFGAFAKGNIRIYSIPYKCECMLAKLLSLCSIEVIILVVVVCHSASTTMPFFVSIFHLRKM